jgi:uncharacterized metal-binding protein YceD (DUF177 family)
MAGDFGYRIAIETIRDGHRIDLTADQEERKAICDRLGLLSLQCLKAHVTLDRDGSRVRASGRIRASLEQSCIATGDPVAEHIDEPFELVFVPEPAQAAPDPEIELGEADCDVVFYEGRVIDLGTAIADTLALAMNPYPRSAGADAALKEAGVLGEAEAGPFAALAKLKRGSDEL